MARSLPSKLLIAFSSILLAHACYSAHEHSLLSTTAAAAHDSSSSSPHSATITSGSTLPLDITLETLLSVSLLLVGIVSSGWELKPISLRSYAGGVESGKILVDGKKGKGLFVGLEERAGFADIRKQRKEFTDWMKTQGRVE
ncbi:hypothetical protein AOL_s00173g323 [Orbilia oligospora ATCC 24927]|uniref:Magnesium transporter n=2 Tax=Orbilia oligospora TaxID=2813651 RepID=G1XPF5_ARTOA|nr:hypothetical protein AOL_s00173g323 [Orbilia oligospora ATCC 24927]EGX45222.1 hypothetical protein AOL_s00173g323 [Orbilia oligospora ATCC 24927]KAF3208300.1 hypothetical protein TWF191_000693 [Orbilia oligospora]KAF3232845.1 hypothetical protein TWF192_002823 [Orbilia oligospora]KAF3286943.1 hypothetical protein TWF970_008773 [Orbilia oligospora]